MKRILSFLLLLAGAFTALATGTTATVSWIAPTSYTDGSALPGSDLKNYTVSWTRVGSSTVVGSVTVNAPTLTVNVPALCGDYSFSVIVTTSASAKYPNASSGPTSPVPYISGIACAPNPPSGVTVS